MTSMKRFLFCFLSVMLVCLRVDASLFPEPDWGALLEEKKQMVSEVDFELYAEGSTGNAPYFGARLEPRSGVYFGVVAENSKPFHNLSSYLTFFSVNDCQEDIYWPANEIISSSDAVTVVGMTVTDINTISYDGIRKQLDTLASYNKPMFIRFANEMNVSPIGDNPQQYISVFRRVADMIHEYDNFAVVWSPNDLGGLDRPFSYYYPGDEYVDWVGVSSYQKKYFLGNVNTTDIDATYFMTGPYAFTTNALKPIIRFMEENNIKKPVMISEGGVAVDNAHGEELRSFAEPRLRNMYWNTIMKYPQVKLINYFNVERPSEKEEYYISEDQYAIDILNEAAASGAYIGSGGAQPLFTYTPAMYAGSLPISEGMVNLYTLAHFPNQPEISVNYRIDGTWYHGTNKAPYKCRLDVSGLSVGDHTLEISSNGISKTYTFFRSEAAVEFVSGDAGYIRVRVNGIELKPDVSPVIIDGRTLIPLRAIFEALGADVHWDEKTKTITAKRGGDEIKLTVGKREMMVNGNQIILDVPGMIIDGRTMVPARAVSESLGCRVGWSNLGKIVSVYE